VVAEEEEGEPGGMALLRLERMVVVEGAPPKGGVVVDHPTVEEVVVAMEAVEEGEEASKIPI
jgi:hypothetical protein